MAAAILFLGWVVARILRALARRVLRDAAITGTLLLVGGNGKARLFDGRDIRPLVLDRLDELLDRQGILSGLTYVPVRIRPSAQPRDQATRLTGQIDVEP